ncbi:hypothetical protein CB0940_11713 [Cercospora beticola]|uniref:Zinc finger PHD-type domain-containing protein n=1 Tax=Cercospora beticola TaxID=122368 RepID=A0A2G5IE73_CERBT|nr:hypothetical protein CB0940_11713 [Cercospora beticola]PIB02814.1 hypothetical protein CB0940_11713 [Cercospora beticola]
MDSSRRYLDTAERATCVATSHLEVRNWEPGLILNERYTKSEYLVRRHGHLGRHPATRDIPRLARTAAGDAKIIFMHHPMLSAQSVRRLELYYAFEQLTPYPTGNNMETDSALYPPSEWQPGVQTAAQVANALSETQDFDTNLPRHPHRAAWDLMATAVRNPPLMPETLNQIINDLSYPLGTITKAPPQHSTRQARSGQRILRWTLNRTGPTKPPHPPPSPKRPRLETAEVEDTLLEPQHQKGKKRAADSPSPSHDSNGTEAPASPSPARPTKRPRTETPPVELLLPGVVSGNRLPKSRKEAVDGAIERKKILERAHLIVNPDTAVKALDFPPEFHSPENFTQAERTALDEQDIDNGPIRCICGENRDVASREEWIQCDGENCGVWQHVICMEDGVESTVVKRQAKTYLCQVCDPWRHRKVLQRLRRQNPDPMGRAERERDEAAAVNEGN